MRGTVSGAWLILCLACSGEGPGTGDGGPEGIEGHEEADDAAEERADDAADVPAVGPEAVRLNEFLLRPAEGAAAPLDHLWVELVNPGDAPASLDGVRLVDQDGTDLADLDAATIAARGFLTVHFADGEDVLDDGLHAQHVYVGTDPAPDAAEGSLELRAGRTEIDAVAWGPEAPSPAGAFVVWSGYESAMTIARWFDGLDRDGADDWRLVDVRLAYRGFDAPPENQVAVLPRPMTVVDTARPEFEWEAGGDTAPYEIEIARDPDFATVDARGTGLDEGRFTPDEDLEAEIVYWRVRGHVGTEPTAWSAPWALAIDHGDWVPVDDGGADAGGKADGDPHPIVWDVPFHFQHKDTNRLCLRHFTDRHRAGCNPQGVAAFNLPHPPTGPEVPPYRLPNHGGAHDRNYCARATIQMINQFFGGDLTQDRISYHVFGEVLGDGIFYRLGHERGLGGDEPREALEWALGLPAGGATWVPAGDTEGVAWADVNTHVGRGGPLYGRIAKADVGAHAVAIVGADQYRVPTWWGGRRTVQTVVVHDPYLGPQMRWVLGTFSDEPPPFRESLQGYSFTKLLAYDPAGVTARMQEPGWLADGDGDGIVDGDETMLGTLPNVGDSDADGVPDLKEVIDITYGLGSFQTPARRATDPDIDGFLAPSDCNSDAPASSAATHFDGGEDVDGDGYYGTLVSYTPADSFVISPGSDTDTHRASDGRTDISIDGTGPFHVGDRVTASGGTYHAWGIYSYAVMPCDPPPAHDDPLTLSGTALAGANGTFSGQEVHRVACEDVRDGPRCARVVLDVLGNLKFDAFHVPGPVPAARCTDPNVTFEMEPVCGDDCASTGEECGEPGLPSCPPRSECVNCLCVPYCGDGWVDPPEECDPPSPPGTCTEYICSDACRLELRTVHCGDTCVDTPPEECDPPSPPGTCTAYICSDTCLRLRRTVSCGDTCTDPPLEECDPPGSTCLDGSICDASCLCPGLPPCGNGVIDPSEECDPPGSTCPDGSACDASCLCPGLPHCGDGVIDPPEECDPPSPAGTCDSPYCSADCELHTRTASCGDGCADSGEECGEPGLAACAAPRDCVRCKCVGCGDGMVLPPEDCDPPGSLCPGGAVCAASCLCPGPCWVEIVDLAGDTTRGDADLERVEFRADSFFDVFIDVAAPIPAAVPTGLSFYGLSAVIFGPLGEFRASVDINGTGAGTPLAGRIDCDDAMGAPVTAPATVFVVGDSVYLTADPSPCAPGLMSGATVEGRSMFETEGGASGGDATDPLPLPPTC